MRVAHSQRQTVGYDGRLGWVGHHLLDWSDPIGSHLSVHRNILLSIEYISVFHLYQEPHDIYFHYFLFNKPHFKLLLDFNFVGYTVVTTVHCKLFYRCYSEFYIWFPCFLIAPAIKCLKYSELFVVIKIIMNTYLIL